MINLVWDGNYILIKNIMTLIKNNCLYGDFHKALTMNIHKYITMFPRAKVWIVFDSRKKSWRKQVITQYKENRVKDPTINWEWIFNELDVWKTAVRENENWIILQGDEVEGDDWIMSVVKSNNKKKESNVVIASDGDLKQLLGWKDNLWINIQVSDINGKEKIFLPEGYEVYLNKLVSEANSDPFDLSRMDIPWSDTLTNMIKSWDSEEVNPHKVLFTKLIKGDKGDNIDSVYKKTLKTGKTQGIGDAGADKIWKLYTDMHGEVVRVDTKNDQMYDRIVDCIELNGKYNFMDETKHSIKEKLIQNASLIELNYRHYPAHILEKIVEELEKVYENG